MNAPHRVSPNPLVEAALEFGERLGIDAPWETNAQGQLIVNPPEGFVHAERADRILTALKSNLPAWRVWPELGLHTADGVKAPDLSAAPPDFAPDADGRGYLLRAAALCIEIMSPTNTWAEMQNKTALCLAAGAQEVWICDETGAMRFFDGAGERAQSAIVPAMARHLAPEHLAF